MAVTSNRLVQIAFTGDVEYTQEFSAPVSALGSGINTIIDLASGNNAIAVPDDAVACTIIPPSDNTETITLKGVNGDTGILLALNAPASISLDGSGANFVLAAGGTIAGVRLIFS